MSERDKVSDITVRFAPSPNGFLHLGHAYSALKNYWFARDNCGLFLLRIEDIDGARAKPEFEQAIYEDLAWLGLSWEEPVRRQSDHLEVYAAALENLKVQGLLYPCRCTRGDIRKFIADKSDWPKDPDGSPLYPGTCRPPGGKRIHDVLSSSEPVAWRIDMHAAMQRLGQDLFWRENGEAFKQAERPLEIKCDLAQWGDVVLGRKDISVSYHIAVVVDDARQRITDIIRGRDLYHATAIHRLLQALLQLDAPDYHHHHLIKDDMNLKLSKSAGTPGLRQLRAQGLTASDIRRHLGFSS